MRTRSLLFLVFVLTGCPELPEGRFACSDDSDCPRRWSCNVAENRCYSREQDAAVTDAALDAITDGAPDGNIDIPSPMTTCTTQGQAGTRTFAINTLLVPQAPVPSVAFNLDGLTTTSANDVAGCRRVDLTGGVENALSNVDEDLTPILSQGGLDSFGAHIQKEVMESDIDLEIVMSDWNMTASDPCVVLTLQGSVQGSAITPLVGRAALSNKRIDLITFDHKLRLTAVYAVLPDGGLGSCTSGCVNIPVSWTVQGVRARIELSADLAMILSTESSLGGAVRFAGADPDALAPSITSLFNQIDPGLSATVLPIFEGYQDLDTTPSLRQCVSLGGMQTSADTLSAAFRLGGVSTP